MHQLPYKLRSNNLEELREHFELLCCLAGKPSSAVASKLCFNVAGHPKLQLQRGGVPEDLASFTELSRHMPKWRDGDAFHKMNPWLTGLLDTENNMIILEAVEPGRIAWSGARGYPWPTAIGKRGYAVQEMIAQLQHKNAASPEVEL